MNSVRLPLPRFDLDNLDWQPMALDVMKILHIDEATVLGVLQSPTHWAREVTRTDVGVAWKLRRGDVVVTVGMADPERPLILHVRRRIYQDQHKVQEGRSGNAGVHWPRSKPELKKMAVALGYRISVSKNGRGHDEIIDPASGYRIAQISSTPSDQNAFEACWRKVLSYHRSSRAVG